MCNKADSGAEEESAMEERLSAYVCGKVNIAKKWVGDMLKAERPIDAAIQWTASKQYKKGIEKAVWLLCFKKQVLVLDRAVAARAAKIKQLTRELQEKTAAEEKGVAALQAISQERAQMARDHQAKVERLEYQIAELKSSARGRMEHLEYQVREARGSEVRLMDKIHSLTQELKEQEEKVGEVKAAYKLACAQGFEDADHGPCRQEIESLGMALARAKGMVCLLSPKAGQSDFTGNPSREVPQAAPRTTLVREPEASRPSPIAPSFQEVWQQGGVEDEALGESQQALVDRPGPGPVYPLRQRRYGPPADGEDLGAIQNQFVVPHGTPQLRAMVSHIPKLTVKGDPSLHFREIEQAACVNDCDEAEQAKMLLFSLGGDLLQTLSDECKRGQKDYEELRDEILEAMGLNDGSPFARVGKTVQLPGESPQAFADRLWPVYRSACPGMPGRTLLNRDQLAHWLRCLMTNCLPQIRTRAAAWFDPRSPQTKETVIRQLTMAFKNIRGIEMPQPKGKVHEVKPGAQHKREWHQEGNRPAQAKLNCYGCGKDGHWRKDCKNPWKDTKGKNPTAPAQKAATGEAETGIAPAAMESFFEAMRSFMASQGKIAATTGVVAPSAPSDDAPQ